MNERERRLDQIREYASKLDEVATGYERLLWMAERAEATGAFIELAECAGALTMASLEQLATLLEILRRSQHVRGNGQFGKVIKNYNIKPPEGL